MTSPSERPLWLTVGTLLCACGLLWSLPQTTGEPLRSVRGAQGFFAGLVLLLLVRGYLLWKNSRAD